MSGVDALSLIPKPHSDDPEDVAWALSTAEALWKRGEYHDAVNWIRKAATAASEVEADTRVIELAKAAAELATLVEASGARPPPKPEKSSSPPAAETPKPTTPVAPPSETSIELEDVETESLPKQEISVARKPPGPPPKHPVASPVMRSMPTPNPMPSPLQPLLAGDLGGDFGLEIPVPDDPAHEPEVSPQSVRQIDSRRPVGRTDDEATTEGLDDDSLPRVPTVPPAPPDYHPTPMRMAVAPALPLPNDGPVSGRLVTAIALAPVLDVRADRRDAVAVGPPLDMRGPGPSSAMLPPPSLEAPSAPPPAAPMPKIASPRLATIRAHAGMPASTPPSARSSPPLSAAPPAAPPLSSVPPMASAGPSVPMPVPRPAPSTVPRPLSVRPPKLELDLDGTGRPETQDRLAPARVLETQPGVGTRRTEVTETRAKASPSVAPSVTETQKGISPSTPPRPSPFDMPKPVVKPKAVDPSRCDALADVPDDARERLVAAGEVVALLPDEEIDAPSMILVLQGEVEVRPRGATATLEIVGADQLRLLTPIAPCTGALVLVGGQKGARVLSLPESAVEELRAAAPWVLSDLEPSSDDLFVVVGALRGEIGRRLDDSLLTAVLGRAETMRLAPGAIVVKNGELVRALVVIGAGSLSLRVSNATDAQELGSIDPGEVLFPRELLERTAAPSAARAGPDGALVLVTTRAATEELLVTFPPLLEILGEG